MTHGLQPGTSRSFWLLPIAGLALAVIGFILWFVFGGVADNLLATIWRGAWIILIIPVSGLIGVRILHDLFQTSRDASEQAAGSGDVSGDGSTETAHIYAVRAILFLFAFGLPLLIMHSSLIGDDLKAPASDFWSSGWMTIRYALSAIILVGIAASFYLGLSRPTAFAVGWIIAMTAITYDWIMTAEPGWVSSGLPILVAGFSILAGCAVRAALTNDAKDTPHWSKLLVILIMLGAFLALAHQLVVWSGDRPGLTVWYVTRLDGGWVWFQLIGVLLLPVALIILLLSGDLGDTRASHEKGLSSLHAASGLVLISVVIQSAWWVLPGHSNVLFACLFTLAMLALLNWFIRAAVTTGPQTSGATS